MKALFATLSPTTWIVAFAVILGLWAGHVLLVNRAQSKGYEAGLLAGQQEGERNLAAYKAKFQATLGDAKQEAADTTLHLQQKQDQTYAKYETTIASLTARVEHLSGELRKRPSRPQGSAGGSVGVSGAAAAPDAAGRSDRPLVCGEGGDVSAGATGQQLYSDDALWLVAEAKRADQLRAAYQKLTADYDSVRVELTRLRESSLNMEAAVNQLDARQ